MTRAPIVKEALRRRVDYSPSTDAKALATRILEAGQRRRGTEPTLPLARAIIAAGVKARTAPTAPELPEHQLARAICLAGQKANGTIDAAGERFLSDYLGKFEATRELIR